MATIEKATIVCHHTMGIAQALTLIILWVQNLKFAADLFSHVSLNVDDITYSQIHSYI